MTDPDITRRVAESRAAQGLPPKITDPAIIARIAAVCRVVDAAPPLSTDQVKTLRAAGFPSTSS